MKLVIPLAAGLLLWPLAAGAQGYSGVMPPQQGFRTPPTAPAAAPVYNGPGGHLDSPYTGTGASDTTGYISTTAPAGAGMGGADTGGLDTGAAAGGDGEAPMEVAPEPLAEDEDAAAPPTSAYTDSFKPKEKDEDENASAGSSIYDTVNANAGNATERRRRAIIRKVEAAQRKAQHEVDRANEERARQTRAMVQKTVDDQRRKERKERGEDVEDGEDSGSYDETGDGSGDAGSK